ncbi:cell wall protein DAN4-like isoform X2 [Clarias magur]|uniref:Cell wall protein DAN4-like isoform X2 n=1 Tax=Clarias magur TaxID=1594786 RepID=A0A8J4XCD7_CLAMG|nr:cell wall protein DAN4-like isoform X2 [Clarias magur]
MTGSTLFTTHISHTSQMLRTSLNIELDNIQKSDSDGNRKQNTPVTSQNPEEKKKALEWTEHFCQSPDEPWAKRVITMLDGRAATEAVNTPPSWTSTDLSRGKWTDAITPAYLPGTSYNYI